MAPSTSNVRLLDSHEVCDTLGIARSSLWVLVRVKHELRALSVNGSLRFRSDDVADYIERLTARGREWKRRGPGRKAGTKIVGGKASKTTRTAVEA